MTERFKPKLSTLPKAQQEIWPQLAPKAAFMLGFPWILPRNTAAISAYLAHRARDCIGSRLLLFDLLVKPHGAAMQQTLS
jgi:hypothetical protein